MEVVASLARGLTRGVDALVRSPGASCNKRFAAAVAEYLTARRDRKTTAQLDQVYREQPSRLAPDLRRAQGRSLPPEEWPFSLRS